MKWTRRLRHIDAKAKWIILAAGICLLLLILILLPSGKVNQNKATWLWDASLIRSETEEIVAFSGREGITTIFCKFNKRLRTRSTAISWLRHIGRASASML